MKGKDYISLHEYSERVGINYRTAIRYFKAGKIKGIQYKKGGRILIKNPFLSEKEEVNNKEKRVVLYVRVSSTINKNSLDGQIERIRDYSAAKGYKIVKEVKEIASGLNDERRKLTAILKSDDWDILLVEHKDRLTRFGFNYFDSILNKNGQVVEVINSTENKDRTEEIMDDFVSIVTSFAGRIYGSNRKKKTKEIIDAINKEN